LLIAQSICFGVLKPNNKLDDLSKCAFIPARSE